MLQFLHTRLRVSDMEVSIGFYQKLGFILVKSSISPQGNKLTYLSIPGSEHLLELCWSQNYQVAVPEDLMHTCIGVDDIVSFCTSLEEQNIEIWPADWKETFTNGGLKMAFVTDPDGYEVEILENKR